MTLGAIATVAMTLMLAASPSVASSRPRTLTTAAQAQDVGAVYFLNPRVGWASVGNSARLLMTTDGGANWRDISPPMLRKMRQSGLALASGLAGATFLSPSDFFVSTSYEGPLLSAVVFHTTDGGKKVALGRFGTRGWRRYLAEIRKRPIRLGLSSYRSGDGAGVRDHL
jgi:hypothetical protein